MNHTETITFEVNKVILKKLQSKEKQNPSTTTSTN